MVESTGTTAALHRLNVNTVLSSIRREGPLTRADIERSTNLSHPTVIQAVKELVAQRIVVESSAARRPSRPGPSARLLRFDARAGYLLGVDIGAEKAIVAAADLEGQVIASERVSTRDARSSKGIVRCVRKAIDAVEQSLPAETPLCAAAIGTPGVVDSATGVVTVAPQLPGWEGLNVAQALFGNDPDFPVATENEMRLAVLGEHRAGAAQELSNVVYVGLGIGVGAGILVGGQLVRGAHGCAGEIGYLPLPQPSRRQVSATKPGTFESAVGALAWKRTASALRRRTGVSETHDRDDILLAEAARAGDPAALAAVGEIVDVIGSGVASICLVLDPDVVIIGGGLSGAGDVLLGPLREVVNRLVPRGRARLVPSTLGDMAVVVGAVNCAAVLSDEAVGRDAPDSS